MARFGLVLAVALCLTMSLDMTTAQLKTNFYGKSCPVEQTVKTIVNQKVKQTFVTIPAVLRLFFHDCIVKGCDASVMIASTPNNKAERDHPDNLSLAGDGFDTVIKAKTALEAISSCKKKVSCADILAIAARDVVVAAGGPFYAVELGRLDGLVSTAASVSLPGPNDKVDKLDAVFSKAGLDQADMIALSGAHTLGFAHCAKFSSRIYSFSSKTKVDPSLNKTYVKELQAACPKNVDPRIAINMDPTTPQKFDNAYYKNLQQGKGMFTSDQVLFTDGRTRTLVNAWANDAKAFNSAFITAMTKLGRAGIKTKANGNIRLKCDAFN